MRLFSTQKKRLFNLKLCSKQDAKVMRRAMVELH